LRLYQNGLEQVSITGQGDWQQQIITLPAGVQNLQWNFARNYSGPPLERAWVDQVQFVPAPVCPVTLSPGNASHPSSPSTGVVSVAAAACAWNVFNTNAWIAITSGTNGTGNGSVTYVLTTNSTTIVRNGNLRIGNQNFLITQLAGGTPTFTNVTAML